MNRRFGVFLLASLLANVGGWINFLAILNLAVWRFNATPFELVMLSAALLLPSVLLTKTISRVCTRYAGSTVIVLSLATTVASTAALMTINDFAQFLVVVAVKSAALAFVDPWEMQYVTQSVNNTHHASAFRALAFTQNAAKIGAPAAGAMLSLWVGDGQTLLLSIVLISLAIVLMVVSVLPRTTLTRAAPPANPQAKPNVTLAWWRGPLVPLLYCAATSFAMSAAINNQFPRMLKIDGFGEAMLGLLVSSSAVGGIIGSTLPLRDLSKMSSVGALVRPAIGTAIVFIMIGGIFRLPVHAAQYLLTCAFFSTGLIGARFRIACRLYITQHCASTVAHASATLQSCAMLTQLVAPCVGALLIGCLTTSDVFIVLGMTAAAILLTGGASLQHRQRRATSLAAGSELSAGSHPDS